MSEPGALNGNMTTKDWELFLKTEWPQHRKESVDSMKKINEIHVTISAIGADTRHLQKLDGINSVLEDMRDSLIKTVSGKDIMSTQSAQEMLHAQQESYSKIITA